MDHSKKNRENDLKGAFMAKITHELRSPLNSIVGFAELMYHGKVGAVSPEHKEYLGDILTSARHLLLLINDMLDIAKVEAGRMEFYPESVNSQILLDEIVHIFKTFSDSKKIQIKTEIDPTTSKVFTDPTRLKQILYNFVSNAIKCTPENGNITIRLYPQANNFFRIEVEDTGIGIREEDKDRLFIEFEQLDRGIAKKYPSTGLGLALTKNIVEAQGGEIGMTSTYGKGSTFFAILPCTQTGEKNENKP